MWWDRIVSRFICWLNFLAVWQTIYPRPAILQAVKVGSLRDVFVSDAKMWQVINYTAGSHPSVSMRCSFQEPPQTSKSGDAHVPYTKRRYFLHITCTYPPTYVKTYPDLSLSKLCEIVRDREAWRAAVHEVADSWMLLSNWKRTTDYLQHLTQCEYYLIILNAM